MPALQRPAAQSVDITFCIANSDESGKQSLYPDGDPPIRIATKI